MNDDFKSPDDLTPAALSAEDWQFLGRAAEYLEQPGLLMKLANLVGKPAEGLLNALPNRAQALVGEATQKALERSLDWAVSTLPPREGDAPAKWFAGSGPQFHLALTCASGAVGGMFGIAGAAIEIPTTTTVMLRSIAEIAARQGFDVRDPRTRLECLSVFSLGSNPLQAMESAYFSSRLGMAMAMRDAARYLARHAAQGTTNVLSHGTAPVLIRLLNQIGARFQIVVTEKMAAQAVPIAGAAMGSLINAAFMQHFNKVAEFHFGILRLEQRYGAAAVQAAYLEARQPTLA